MTKTCENCKAEFKCLVDDIKNCHCNRVRLKPQEILTLGEFKDCLCNDCLKGAKEKEIDNN
jgi:Cysteine-rich CWC